jgi:hypothetical protein
MKLKLLKGFELRIKDKKSGKVEVIASWKPILPMVLDEDEKEFIPSIIIESEDSEEK